MGRLGEVTGAVLLVEDFEDVFGRFLEDRETEEATGSAAYHTRCEFMDSVDREVCGASLICF